MTARFAIASPQMKTLFAAMLATFLLPGCSKDVAEVHESESEIRDQLAGFLDAALDEFTNRYGSHTEPWGVGNERWETPFVEAGLLVMAAREFARIEAFSQGLEYERPDPPILKPPTPRSFWLPISPEGTYSFEIISVSASGDKALASVNFTMALDGTAYPDTHVTYSLLRSGDRWRISNVTSADGYNLRKYLLRSHVMDDGD